MKAEKLCQLEYIYCKKEPCLKVSVCIDYGAKGSIGRGELFKIAPEEENYKFSIEPWEVAMVNR